MFALIALVTAASIVAHSSTDVVVARWLRATKPHAEPDHHGGTATAA